MLGLLGGGGPGVLVPVEREGLVDREIEIPVERLEHPVHALGGPFAVDGKNRECGVEIARGPQLPADHGPEAGLERLLVAGEKEHPLVVEVAHELGDQLVEGLLRHRDVEVVDVLE